VAVLFGPSGLVVFEREGEPRLGFWWVGVGPGGSAPADAKKNHGPATLCIANMACTFFKEESRGLSGANVD
jgi:hypothetical protein